MKIHVLLKKEELDGQRLPGKIVVVLDILFATSSIVAAVANGAQEVVPFLDGEAALGESRKRKAGSFVLSGELNAATLEGFCHPTPLALIGEGVASKSVIYCTTNGTVAIARSREASRVYAAALLNGEAMVEHVERTAKGETVLIVCSGSADNFNLEDFYGAGYLVSLFARNPEHELSDAAVAAHLLHDRSDAYECLSRSRVGRMMLDRGLESEVRFAARKSCFDVVVALEDGSLRAFR